MELTLPGGRLATSDGGTEEWTSTVVPRYQRRMREVNEAVDGVYLSGGNTRRIRGALRPLLKGAPLSKSAVSRIVATLRGEWEAWSKQSLADLNVVYLYLDAIALRVRAVGRGTGLPVLAGVAVLKRRDQDERDRADQRRIQAAREDPRLVPDGELCARPALVASGQINLRRLDGYEKPSMSSLARRTPPPNQSCYTTPKQASGRGAIANFHIKRDTTLYRMRCRRGHRTPSV